MKAFPAASGFLSRFENIALAIPLAGLAVIPLAEIVLRKFFSTGISQASSLVQHLTLIAGIIGASIAAREGLLLSLSTISEKLKGRFGAAVRIFCGGCAAAVSAALCIAGVQFVLAEKSAQAFLSYGVPVWLVEAVMPVGFGLIALRLTLAASRTWTGRIAAGALAGVLLLVGIAPPIAPDRLVMPALALLVLATTLGVPVFVTLGGVALILFWGRDVPIAAIPVGHYALVVNPAIATIPLFTLAGYFLAEGGAPKRLVRVFQAFFGRIPGGSAVVTTIVCAFFTSFTGASGITIVALGGLLMPVLREDSYSEKAALGLVTGSGSLGLLFPPCLPLILYAIVAGVPIQQIFLAGIIPGFIMLAGTAWWGIRQSRPRSDASHSFEWREARSALWEAKWELLLPIVALAALFGGYATPVEASALTALYAFLTQSVIHRDLSLRKDVLRVMTDCGVLVGGVLLILGIARGLTNYLVDADVTARAVEWTTSTIESPIVFLLLLNLFLLVVGCLMDIYSAILIQVPLLVPIGAAFGLNPLHLGIIFLANLEIGYLTPPVGLNLFMASYRFGKPVGEVLRAVAPIAFVMLGTVLLITFVPWLTTFLPEWLGR